jgi:hypothetical protein
MPPDTDAKPLWWSFHDGSAWPFFLECLANAAFLARSVAAGVPLIAGRGRLAFSLIAWRILPLATSEPHSGHRICVLTKEFPTSWIEYLLNALSNQEKSTSPKFLRHFGGTQIFLEPLSWLLWICVSLSG